MKLVLVVNRKFSTTKFIFLSACSCFGLAYFFYCRLKLEHKLRIARLENERMQLQLVVERRRAIRNAIFCAFGGAFLAFYVKHMFRRPKHNS